MGRVDELVGGCNKCLPPPTTPKAMALSSEAITPFITSSELICLARRMKNWVNILPGVMLTFNEMTEGQHGFTASQILWGQGMNLPMDLTHGRPAGGNQDVGGYVRDLRKRLNDIRWSVAPFNKQKGEKRENPSKVGN